MFKREPSKVFLRDDRFLIGKVLCKVYQHHLVIEIKHSKVKLVLNIPKPFTLIEGEQYCVYINDKNHYECSDENIYVYRGEKLFKDSYLELKKRELKFVSCSAEIDFISTQDMSIELSAVVEYDAEKENLYLKLFPIMQTLEIDENKPSNSTHFKEELNNPSTQLFDGKKYCELLISDFKFFPFWVYDLENENADGRDETWVVPWRSKEIPDDDFIATIKVLDESQIEYTGIANMMFLEGKKKLEIYSLDIKLDNGDFETFEDFIKKIKIKNLYIDFLNKRYRFKVSPHFIFPIQAYLA